MKINTNKLLVIYLLTRTGFSAHVLIQKFIRYLKHILTSNGLYFGYYVFGIQHTIPQYITFLHSSLSKRLNLDFT